MTMTIDDDRVSKALLIETTSLMTVLGDGLFNIQSNSRVSVNGEEEERRHLVDSERERELRHKLMAVIGLSKQRQGFT